MNLDEQTKWIHKNSGMTDNQIEGMVQYGESEYKPATKRKKSKKQLQPFNLTTAPLQDIRQEIGQENRQENRQENAPTATATATATIQTDPNPEYGFKSIPSWLTTINLHESFVEGIGSNNVCASIGEKLKPIIETIDFVILWIVDKLCIEYPTLMIAFVAQTFCDLGFDIDPKIPIDVADKALIEDQFKIFLSMIISCWVVYNWFFLLFYESKPKTVTIDKYIINNYNSILGYFFKYLIEPVTILNWVLIDVIPRNTTMFVSNAKILFIGLLLLIIYITRTYGASYMRAFSSNLKRTPDLYAQWMISIMTFSSVFSAFIAIDTLRGASILGVGAELLGMSETNKLSYSFSELMNYGKAMPMLLIPQLFSFIIRITFSIACVWLAGILAFGYLLLYSFFAIPLYATSSTKATVFEIYNAVHGHSASHIYDDGIIHQIINFINWIFVMLYTYIYEIIFIIFFIQSIINYSANIHNNNLLPIIVIITVVCLMVPVYSLYKRYNDNNPYMDTNILNEMNPQKPTESVEPMCNKETVQPITPTV